MSERLRIPAIPGAVGWEPRLLIVGDRREAAIQIASRCREAFRTCPNRDTAEVLRDAALLLDELAK